jgi:hypothetical protein
MNEARIAGKSDEEIRDLVKTLEEIRKGSPSGECQRSGFTVRGLKNAIAGDSNSEGGERK